MPNSRRARADRKARAAGLGEEKSLPSWRPYLLPLALVFVLSLAVRIPGVYTLGIGLDGPGTWQIVNYDESNSCEAALGTVPYPTWKKPKFNHIKCCSRWYKKGPSPDTPGVFQPTKD